MPRSPVPRRVRGTLLAVVALTAGGLGASAGPAGAFSTTLVVPPGGTASTGAVTAAEPVQASITSSTGGSFVVATDPSPSFRNPERTGSGPLDYAGPQLSITPPCGEADPGCERFGATIVLDSALFPAPGNGTGGVISKNRQNTKAEIFAFCSRGQGVDRCHVDDPFARRENPSQPRVTLRPDGDIQIVISPTETGGPNSGPVVLDFGTFRKRLGLNLDRTADLGDLLAGTEKFAVFCTLRCVPTVKLTVSSAIARKFRLPSATIASRTFALPGLLTLAPSAANRRRLRKAKRITVTVTVTARGDDGKVMTTKATTIATPAAQDG